MTEAGSGLHAGTHKVIDVLGFPLNIDTVIMTWIVMAIVIVIGFLATRNVKIVPGRLQSAIEMIVIALIEQVENNMGPKGRIVVPIIITLFLFIFVSNELGLIPGGFVSPTADLNTTLGLAIFVALLVHIMGIKQKGFFKHFKHFFEPFVPFVIINIVEEIARPITLAFRLFGNILAGEILLEVLTTKLVPFVIPSIWLGFSLVVGLIQAAIFTILTISYLSNSFKEEH